MLNIFFFNLLLLLHLSMPQPCFGADTVKIAAGEWPPFISAKVKGKGFLAQIVEAAFAKEDVKVEWSFVPWKRALEDTKRGDYHASAAWVKTAERAEKFHVTDSVVETKLGFFYKDKKKDRFEKFTKLKEFKGLKIGTTIGYNYGPEFTKLIDSKTLTVEAAPSDEINFLKLKGDRIDTFTVELMVGEFLLNQLLDEGKISPAERKSLVVHPKHFVEEPLHMLFSKKGNQEHIKKLFDKFQVGLAKLKKEGLHLKIHKDFLSRAAH